MRVERVDFTIKDWWGIEFEVDSVVVYSFWGKVLSFFFREDFSMSVVFLRDGIQGFILVGFNGPFLCKVSVINDNFITFLPFMGP
jgi:hypothetical protein